MPLIKPPASGEDGAQRTTFRPPWVKEGPPALPMPSAPWLPKRRESQTQQQPTQNKGNVIPVQVQRQDSKSDKNTNSLPRQNTKPEKTVTTIQRQDNLPKSITTKSSEKNSEPVQVQRQESKPERNTNVKVVPVQRQDTKPERNVNKIPIQRQETQRQEPQPEKNVSKAAIKKEPVKVKEMPPASKKEETKPPLVSKQPAKPEKKDEVKKKVQIREEPEVMEPPPAAPPMAPPMPPPPPPMAPSKPPIDLKPLTSSQKAKLDSLKSRPRKRPDWTDMMKEVEEGVKLKKVICNDRSAPVLPKAKAKGQFVYESEKGNAHNQLLKEIQGGIRLKKTKCNDRSKPILDGLRKFRRQMTIEEQIVKKSTSMADVVAMATQPDELDDIDKVRDDLQSTKQMLAHELRNKETLERENKRLMARLLNLEVELEKEKSARSIEKEKGEIVNNIRTAEDDRLISKLKEEAAESAKMVKDMEEMYKKTAEELDVTRAKLESAWLQNADMEQQLKNLQIHPDAPVILPKLPSSKKLANASFSTRPVLMSSSEEESEEEESEEESESEEENPSNAIAQQEKRTARELKVLAAKLRGLKEKRYNAKREKSALKHQFNNLTKALKTENKKYKQIQKEVDKMAKLVHGDDEHDDDDEEEEEEESESDNESDTSDDSVASEGDLPETSPSQDKILNLSRRVKCNENRLTSLKKCNYLLKANIDRRQDEINKQKEQILSMQEDLNAVLEELG